MPRQQTRQKVSVHTPWMLAILLFLATTFHSLAEAGSERHAVQQESLSRLETLAESISRLHALVVSQHGVVVLERAFDGPGVDQPANIKSLSKTVLAALTGAAIEADIIEGVDQTAVSLLGPLVPTNADARVEMITLGHLLSLQSGLERTSGGNYGAWVASPNWVEYALTRPFVDEPGGRMLYSTGSSHLVSAALSQVSGISTLDLARRLLGEPLGIVIPDWPRDPQGIHFGGNDMQLSPRALVEIGELYRNDGIIDGERVLPEGWVDASWTPRGSSAWTGDGYGYGWFVTELAEETVYYGRGFGGQALFVIPARAMTVAITSDPTPPSPGGQFQRELNGLVEHLLDRG